MAKIPRGFSVDQFINSSKEEEQVHKIEFNLGFIHSTHLEKVEEGISHLFKEIIRGKLMICLALHHIKEKELYKQAGFEHFQEYLLAERIGPKKTLYMWARIGEIYSSFKEELDLIQFSEEEGITKLLLLPKAIETTKNREEVFKKLKALSYRHFKNEFILNVQNKLTKTPQNKQTITIEILYHWLEEFKHLNQENGQFVSQFEHFIEKKDFIFNL